jgi:hypothetical protein
MSALLEKFTKVKLKTNTLLPSDDKDALDGLHRDYEEAMERLDEWRCFFEREIKQTPVPGFNFKMPDKTAYVETNSRGVPRFGELAFFAGYPLVEVTKLMARCRKHYVHETYQYFINKYSLRIPRNDDHILESKKLNYLEVVDSIRTSLGGLNFNAIAKQQIIDRMRDECAGRYRGVVISNKNIELTNYASYSYQHIGGDKFSYNCDRLGKLEDAIMLYERGHADKGAVFNDTEHYSEVVNFDSDYHFPNCEKLDAIRFYKNKKVILKFKSAAQAKEFYELFDFETLSN